MNCFKLNELASSTHTPITENIKKFVSMYNKETNKVPVKDIIIFEIDHPYHDTEKLRIDLSKVLEITTNNKLVAIIEVNCNGNSDIADSNLDMLKNVFEFDDISEFVNPKAVYFEKVHTMIKNYKYAIPFKRYIMNHYKEV